jgi:membrane protease YdiL (CAAX protease family)
MELTVKANESRLPLWWIVILAPFGIAFTSLFFELSRGHISSMMQAVGISQGRMFSLLVYNVGTAIAVLVYFLLLKSKGLTLRKAGYRGSLSAKGILWSLAAACVVVMLYPLVEYVAATLGLPMFWQHVGATVVKQETQQDIYMGILTAVVLAPLTEDTIFRGYMLEMFGERYKQWIAVAVSSIIFASIHFQFFGPGLTIYMFFWTIASCILYIRFDHIYPSIIFHMINNTWAYIIVPRIF